MQKQQTHYLEKFSRKTVVRSHQTLGDLFIQLKHDNITDYKRMLNLNKALASVFYKSEGFKVTQEAFVSAPNQILIIKIKSEHPNGLNGSIKLNRPMDEGVNTSKTYTEKGNLFMEGEITQRKGAFNSLPNPILKGVQFQTIVKPSIVGGTLTTSEKSLELKGVKELELRIVSNSSFYNQDFKNQNKRQLNALVSKSLEEIKQTHVKDHQSLFNRVALDLITDNSLQNIPTDKRMEAVKTGDIDLELQQTLFHYGR